MIHAYKADSEYFHFDEENMRSYNKIRIRSDDDLRALAPKIINEWMTSAFAPKFRPYRENRGRDWPPPSPRYSAWRMKNPLPPYDSSWRVIDEGLPYWNHTYKISKEEAKAYWDKLQQEYEEEKKEAETWAPP